MNVKPGDLAVFVKEARKNTPDKILGCVCTVLKAAPIGRVFPMPDHGYHVALDSFRWIVQLQHPIRVKKESGAYAVTVYVTVSDESLRPIRDPGDDAQCESHRWLPPVPTQTKEPA